MGLGHRKTAIEQKNLELKAANKPLISEKLKPWEAKGQGKHKPKPVKPELLNVFHALILDSQAINENFDDWAENYGYSPDSIKALNVYKACLENARIVRKVLTREDIAKLELFYQDY
jgi:hypothetical protein